MKFTSRDWQITFLTGYMLIGSQSNELPKIDCNMMYALLHFETLKEGMIVAIRKLVVPNFLQKPYFEVLKLFTRSAFLCEKRYLSMRKEYCTNTQIMSRLAGLAS
jgi:hypothetical protein